MGRPLTVPLRRSTKRLIADYAIATFFYGLALGVTVLLWGVLPGSFAFFVIAILLAAHRGGSGTAALVIVASIATAAVATFGPERILPMALSTLVRLSLAILVASIGAHLVIRNRENISKLKRVVAARDLVSRSTNDTLWDWDIINDTIYWNEAAETIFGVNRHTSGNDTRSWTDNIHPADTARVVTSIENAVAGDADGWSEHYRFRKRNGSYSDVFDRGYVIRDSEGRAVQMIGSMLDLSERRAAQETIAENEKRMRRQAQLLDLAHDAIIVRDADGHITFWNKGAQEVYGWNAKEAEGQLTHRLFATRFPADLNEINRQLREKGRWDGELTHRRKDGEEIIVGSRWLLSKGGTDAETVLEINRDITEHKRYEQHLLQQSEELSRSNQELEQFAYVASHDLQEPLRKISNYSELLASKTRETLSEEGDRYLTAIRGSAERMQELIHDLLAYSRLTKTDAKPSAVELSHVLDVVLSDLEPRIQEKKARVTVEPGLPAVMASLTELRQVFQNLIGNAVKFNTSECPEVRIAATQGADGCTVTISDNGIGIDPEFHDKIFKVFNRLHTRDKFPGTGIGLAICKKIVERHGGRIWVESSLGSGTTFSFVLPTAVIGVPAESVG